MVEYKLKYEGEKIDELLEAVDNGSVVDTNTVSVIEEGNGKPVSSNTIHQALADKVDKIPGWGLSVNNYSMEDKSRVGNSVTSIRVNGTTISRKDDTGLLDIGDVSNLYVADFTISDLYRLDSGEIESLEVNGKALLQALKDHKAIGLLWNNDSPSMSLASVYVDGNMCLTVICDGTMFTSCVNSPDNYDEVEESKSGLITKEDITIYWIDSYHSYLLDITFDDVKEAYSYNQEITCDYNTLHNAVISHYYISMDVEGNAAVPVNAYIFDEDSIVLSYIIGSNLWEIRIFRVEDENGNVYGRVPSREITNINLYETKNGSRYIITNFILDTILNGGRISVTSELIEAIKDQRPLAIYEEYGGRLCNIEAVEAYLNNSTAIAFDIPYEGGIRVEIISNSIVEEGGSIDVVPTWHYMNDEVRVADFTVQNIIKDGYVTITEQFVNAVQSNAQILIPISSSTNNYVAVTSLQSFISTDSFRITIGFIDQTRLYSVVFSNKGTVPSRVAPKITVTDLNLSDSSFKTINGVSVLGTGNISAIQGLSNFSFKASIGTVNDDGVLEIGPGELAGLSIRPIIITPKDGVISIEPYFRYVCNSVTDNVQIQLNMVPLYSCNEWELLFFVDSAEPITLDVVYSADYSITIRWKEGEISHSTLSTGYYRFRATYVMSINEIWAEIEKFS